jgi:hypothetical protein
MGIRRPAARSASPPRPSVVGRAAWEADEALRFDAAGGERWPRRAEPLRGLVLHHTNTPNFEQDAAARIRAIYAFHALHRGWGDIGYHLLIDEAGSVYEGRTGTASVLDGGPAVVGGHVYGHNRGTLGIALLGTLTDRPPSPPAWSALVAVMAWLAHRHALDPLGVRDAGHDAVPTICAHRDLAATPCPGDACYALLSALRTQVATALSAAA